MSRRFFRLLLLAYPAEFRYRFGGQLEQALRECYRRELSRRGRIGAFLSSVPNILDFVVGGFLERGYAILSRMRPDHKRDPKIPTPKRKWPMSTVSQDIRYAVRTLVKQPAFTLVAVGSLALGIGATTSIFSVANALLLRAPSGVTNADRVVELGRTNGGQGFDTFTYPEMVDLREQASSLDRLSAWAIDPVSFSVGGEGERIGAMPVSANYFEMLGVPRGLGRYFLPEEDLIPEGHPVAVLNHDFWQDRFGADSDVIGATISLNRSTFTVVGVAPKGFRGHTTGFLPQVWVPFMMRPVTSPGWHDFEARNSSSILLLGSLAEGATFDEAKVAVSTVFARLQQEYPDTHARPGNERSATMVMLGPVPGAGREFVSAFVGALAVLVGLVLFITCANVAGMLLARGSAREKEIALRLALGSGRGRLVGHLLTESLLLFLVGGGLGLLVSNTLLNMASAFQLNTIIPLGVDVRADASVFLFAAVATLLTGVVFGLSPALKSTALDLVPSLRDDSSYGGTRKGRIRRVFVTCQLGLSLVLLVAAGLFVRSLQRAGTVNKGFVAENVYLTTFDLSLEGYEGSVEGWAFQEQLLARVRGQPGVESAALAIDLPLDLASRGRGVRPEGWTSPDGEERMRSDFNQVTTGYFETLNIPIIQGRGFAESDREDALAVAIVSESFVEQAWPGGDPIGRTLSWTTNGPQVTVVGVVPDVKNQTITEIPDPMTYVPLSQMYHPSMNLIVRETEGAGIAGALASLVLEQDPHISMTPVATMEAHTGIATLPQRLATWITTILGLVALLLSGLGVYGVISFAVSQRTQEIGIRMALGAESGQVTRLVVGNAVRMALPGLVVGAALAAVLGTVLRTFLLGVSPFDPLTIGTALGLLALLVGVSSWVPARRAARVNPVQALQGE